VSRPGEDGVNPDRVPHSPRRLQYAHELVDFARIVTDIQKAAACTMAEARAEAARLLCCEGPSNDQFNWALSAVGVSVSRGRPGRPSEAFPASLDAAVLFLELRRRGLSRRKSEDAVLHLTGVGKSVLEKYGARAADLLSDDAEAFTACAVGVFLDKLTERHASLEQPARGIVGELLKDARERPESN